MNGSSGAGGKSTCSVCASAFEPKFRYQVREEQGRFIYICSQRCQERSLSSDVQCSACAKSFELEYPYQVQVTDSTKRFFCSTDCLARPAANISNVTSMIAAASRGPRRIAVFNHKGGTGKTTTAVNLAAGLAETGKRVLLIDADAQGNVGASLGIRGEQNLYHVLVLGLSPEDAAIQVRPNFDVLTSNELLAAAELYLATRTNRDRVMRERLGTMVDGYDVVVIDCAPALSLMNQNALVFADSVVVPVSCDYLSLVGVRQVLRTMRNVREHLKHDINLLGVLPTFYDVRNGICREAMTALQTHFGERCLSPVRVNTKLREAPAALQTIFEYAPESNGAADYLTLVADVMKDRSAELGAWHEPGTAFQPEQALARHG